jgi:hypothetical protein
VVAAGASFDGGLTLGVHRKSTGKGGVVAPKLLRTAILDLLPLLLGGSQFARGRFHGRVNHGTARKVTAEGSRVRVHGSFRSGSQHAGCEGILKSILALVISWRKSRPFAARG